MCKDTPPYASAVALTTPLIDLAVELRRRQPESSFQLAQLAYHEARRTGDEAAKWSALSQQVPSAGLLGMNLWLVEYAEEVVRLGRQFAEPRELRRIHGILGIAFLRLGFLAQSADQHAQACALAQQLDAAELGYALYNSSISFNEFHRPERMLELGKEILALDLTDICPLEGQKVSSYGVLTCAVGSLYLAQQALLRGHEAEVWLYAEQGIQFLNRLLDFAPVTDNLGFQQRQLHTHVRLLELVEPSLQQRLQLRQALEDWRAWTDAFEFKSSPRAEQAWLAALGWEAALHHDAAGVKLYFGQALKLGEKIPFEDTIWLRLHSQYSFAARQVGDLQTALEQLQLYTQLLFARLQHEARRTLEEMTVRFQVAQAQQVSQSARLRADTLSELVQQREHALYDEQMHTLERLATVAEYRDHDSAKHIHWVGDASACVAQELGEAPEFVQALQVAARLHDIGKIAIPDAILLKTGRLTPEEFDTIKTHTLIGAEILEGPQHPFLPLAAEIARTHHERWDGGGYPAGLCAEAIPLAGRIVSVVDVYDALRAVRPYKEAWTEEAALNHLQAGASTQFDPRIVQAFLAAHAAGRLPQRDTVPEGG